MTVDGEDWGSTPVTAREVGAGAHDVQVGSSNHHPAQRSVVLGRGQRETVRLSPVPRNRWSDDRGGRCQRATRRRARCWSTVRTWARCTSR
ncbi:MAG: PEGA domain-containing protein [Betaproteobacteria bacterium]|nr:PEGA domain-containing protein [Betaproteobacteria bacterium]